MFPSKTPELKKENKIRANSPNSVKIIDMQGQN
jgi:hypothetical protein